MDELEPPDRTTPKCGAMRPSARPITFGIAFTLIYDFMIIVISILIGYLTLSISAFSPSASAWQLYSSTMVPLAIYGICLLRASTQRLIVEDAA